jgi:radical SAM superfamily enzyme YgiQ (UPF0313 family)
LKAVVIIPPVFDFYFTPHRSSGLGGEILLQLLLYHDFQAVLFNCPSQSRRAVKQELPHALYYLKPYIIEDEIGPLSFFSKYQRFGPSFTKCATRALINEPDLICISCFAFAYAHAAIEMAENIRTLNPRPAIVVGGAGVCAYPEYFIKNPAVDFAITGESEVSVPLFLEIFKSNSKNFSAVPNLYYKSGGKIFAPSHVKWTKPQDISFVFKKTFETTDRIFFTTALSRGCPKSCRFCSNFLSHGRTFRTIPLEVVKDQLARIDQRTVKSDKKIWINFEDDNLLCDPGYFFSVLKAFRSVFPNADFLSENGIDYMLIHPKLITMLIEHGMKQFNISMATIDPISLSYENRNASLSKYEKIMSILIKHGIPSVTYFICGLKHDTKDALVSTLVYLAGVAQRIGISFFYPVPGIQDFSDRSLFDGKPSYLCAGSSAYAWNQSLNTREMLTAFRLSRLINLMHAKIKSPEDEALIKKIFREQKLYTRIKNGSRSNEMAVGNMDEDMVKMFIAKILNMSAKNIKRQ